MQKAKRTRIFGVQVRTHSIRADFNASLRGVLTGYVLHLNYDTKPIVLVEKKLHQISATHQDLTDLVYFLYM